MSEKDRANRARWSREQLEKARAASKARFLADIADEPRLNALRDENAKLLAQIMATKAEGRS